VLSARFALFFFLWLSAEKISVSMLVLLSFTHVFPSRKPMTTASCPLPSCLLPVEIPYLVCSSTQIKHHFNFLFFSSAALRFLSFSNLFLAFLRFHGFPFVTPSSPWRKRRFPFLFISITQSSPLSTPLKRIFKFSTPSPSSFQLSQALRSFYPFP